VPLTFGPPGGHAACQESDRAADPTRSLPARSPTCSSASSQRRPPRIRRRPSSPSPCRHPRVGRNVRLREPGLHHSVAERQGLLHVVGSSEQAEKRGHHHQQRSRALSQVLEETLINTKQVLGIQPWISRAPVRPFFNPNQRIGANLANVTELKQFWAALRGRRASSISASTRWWSTVRR
jgi:hypothetical protein